MFRAEAGNGIGSFERARIVHATDLVAEGENRELTEDACLVLSELTFLRRQLTLLHTEVEAVAVRRDQELFEAPSELITIPWQLLLRQNRNEVVELELTTAIELGEELRKLFLRCSWTFDRLLRTACDLVDDPARGGKKCASRGSEKPTAVPHEPSPFVF
jgi:hypothetical protein